MFKILVIAFIIFLIYSNIKNSKVRKKEEKKPTYTAKTNTNYSNSTIKTQPAVKREEAPKKRVREKKAEFRNAIFYSSDNGEYLYTSKENVVITDIPDDLDFSLLKLRSVNFVEETGEDRYCKCVKVFQEDTLLGYLKKGSPEENEIWFLSGSDNYIYGKIVYIDEEKREIKLSYAVYYFAYEEDLKAEYTDTAMLSCVSDFKDCEYLPSRKEALDEVNLGDVVEFKRDKKKGRYIVENQYADEIGEIAESDLGMLLYYMENEKEYFYVPVVNKLASGSAELEIRVYKKKYSKN